MKCQNNSSEEKKKKPEIKIKTEETADVELLVRLSDAV